MNTRYQAGTISLLKPRDFSLSHEVAAWHTEGQLPEGEYPIFVSINNGKAYLHTDDIEGVITSNYTASLYGGVAIGGRDGSEEVGNPIHRSIGIYEGMLEENEELKVELTDEAKEWLTPGYGGEWTYDESHSAYNEILILENMKKLKKEAIDGVFGYTKEYAERFGFLSDETLRIAAEDKVSETAYRYAIAMDLNTRKYTGKGLDEHGISISEANDYTRGKSGCVKKILLESTKEMLNEKNIEMNVRAIDMSY